MKSRKRHSGIFLAAGLALLPSCQSRTQSPIDTLTTIVAAPVPSLNPLYATDAASQHINELVHSALITISDDLVPIPYLAEEIKTPNPTTLEFRLRRGCVFESGKEITSDDVERSLSFYRDPQNQSAFAEAFKAIIKFEKIDSYRFRMITDQPSPGLLTDFDLLKILDLTGVAPGSKPTHIPGAGPYRLSSLDASQINLERRAQPCLPTPPMNKIRVKVVRDDLSRFLKLKTGEIDLVLNEMNYRKVEVIENDPTLPMTVIKDDGIGYTYLGLNLATKKLSDPRVRRALALSLDVPALIKYKSRGMARPARNVLSDQNFYSNRDVPLIERNLPEAKRLLDEAGYFNGTNGKPPLHLTFKTNTNPISLENARVIVAQVNESGIRFEHQAHDWGVFYNDVKTGNTEVYSLRWVGVTDPRIYFEIFHSKEIGRNNRTRYQNPELDLLLEQAEKILDPSKRREVYLKVQAIVAKDLPYIGLWYGKNVAVFRKEVKNVKLHPSGKWLPLLSMRKE